MMQQHRGFTLIELVVVMLLAGILAVTVLPKLFAIDSETSQSQRDQVLALAFLVQQQSMQDTVNLAVRCPTLRLSGSGVAIATQNPCQPSASYLPDADDPQQLQLAANSSLAVTNLADSSLNLPLLLRFDSWGRPTGACSNGCRIKVQQGNSSAQLCFNASGYLSSC